MLHQKPPHVTYGRQLNLTWAIYFQPLRSAAEALGITVGSSCQGEHVGTAETTSTNITELLL
jgi:hypothetical protein